MTVPVILSSSRTHVKSKLRPAGLLCAMYAPPSSFVPSNRACFLRLACTTSSWPGVSVQMSIFPDVWVGSLSLSVMVVSWGAAEIFILVRWLCDRAPCKYFCLSLVTRLGHLNLIATTLLPLSQLPTFSTPYVHALHLFVFNHFLLCFPPYPLSTFGRPDWGRKLVRYPLFHPRPFGPFSFFPPRYVCAFIFFVVRC